MKKKIIAFLICASLLLPTISVHAIKYDEYMSGRHEYMSASYKISPGLTYTEQLTKNEKYGYERAYIYEYIPDMGTSIVPSFGKYVYGTESLGTLTKKLEDEGKRVVGGINGDFFSTSTGVPIGAMIVDGEIISSDNDRTAMGFDEKGNAFISKPNIKTVLSNENENIEIEHINKYPLEYCLYLLSDKFYSTTKAAKASTEIVLMPYSESVTYMTEEEMPSVEETETETEIETEDGEQQEKFVYIYAEDEMTEAEIVSAEEISEAENTETVEQTEEAEADSENTDMPEESGEDVEITPHEFEKPSYFAKKYTFAEEKLKIGSEIKVVVTEIRYNSTNSAIPEGCFVLCAENEFQYDKVKNISKGTEFTLSVSAEEEWYGAVNAIGNAGGLILNDGEYCDDVEIDHYPYAHPRTAAGITEDGRVIFYCVDGRQESSGGLRIDQLSHEMKELGCVIAMNLDGGGSTTAYAALPGELFSNIKNSPSVSTERKTANSLLFVNTTEKLGEISNFTIFPESPYVLAGGSQYELSVPIPTDANLYPVEACEEFEYEYFTLPEETDSVIVDRNVFVSGNRSGMCNIYLKVKTDDGDIKYKAGHVFVLESPEDFTLGSDKYEISPFDTIKLDFNAIYHTAKFYYSEKSIRWLLPEKAEPEISDETPNEENKDADGEVPEEAEEYVSIPDGGVLENDKISLTEELEIIPKTDGETFKLKAKIGQLVKEITVEIKKFPFIDSRDHWSAKNLFEINSYGLMKGEKVGEDYAFFPSRNLTKAEFITVLARMLYPDIDTPDEIEEENTDTEKTEDIAQIDETSGENAEAERTEEILTEEEIKSDDETSDEPVEVKEAEERQEAESEETDEIEQTDELNINKLLADADKIPDWSKKYFEALAGSGLLELICDYDAFGNLYIKASDKIKRRDVLILLGALCDNATEDFVSTFADTEELFHSPTIVFINNALSAGIFEGYEDGSLRADRELTRAEAATVILRFLNNTATE